MEQRLKAFTKVNPSRPITWIDLPIALRLFRNVYNIMLGFTDICAIQGATSLRNFLANTGTSTINKKLIKECEKSNMLDVLANNIVKK